MSKYSYKDYVCTGCGTPGKTRMNQTFCSRACHGKWYSRQIEQENFARFERGELILVNNRVPMTRFIVERQGGRFCSSCKNFEWMGGPIPLDVDHIDGDKKNNLPSNLRLLCPNCHRLTPTWGRKRR